ncbi:MAG: hypothetical protein NZ455_07810 [Bacteroidia bacterium]|nr:hypothetical protein [Bacteroidia bacterium]
MGLGTAGCGSVKKMLKEARKKEKVSYTVPADSLMEVHADTVRTTFGASLVPKKIIKKKQTYYMIPTLKYASGSKTFDSLRFKWFKGMNKKVPIKKDTTLVFAYSPEMEYSTLELKGVARRKKKQGEQPKDIVIAYGMVTTCYLGIDRDQLVFAKHSYSPKTTTEEVNSAMFFDQGKYNIRRDEEKSDTLVKFVNNISVKRKIVGVKVSGTASPEGKQSEVNQPLSENRAKTLISWLKGQFKNIGYASAQDSSFFNVFSQPEGRGEDWANFEAGYKNTNIPEADKTAIEQILKEGGDKDAMHDKIQKLKSYPQLEKLFYPKLRRSEVTIVIENLPANDYQVAEKAMKVKNGQADYSTLEKEEAMYVLTNYKRMVKLYNACQQDPELKRLMDDNNALVNQIAEAEAKLKAINEDTKLKGAAKEKAIKDQSKVVIELKNKLFDGTQKAYNMQNAIASRTVGTDAELTEGEIKDLFALYNQHIKVYNNDWRAYNNLASWMLKLATESNEPAAAKQQVYTAAKQLLEKADQLKKNEPMVLNGLGVVAKNMKDYKQAMDYFNKAKGASGEVSMAANYNMGGIYIKRGKYDQAIAAFSAADPKVRTTNYNKGLACILSKGYDSAKQALEAENNLQPDATDKIAAMTNYLLAINAARMNNVTDVAKYLSKACKLDASLKDKASKDPEFRRNNIRNTNEFKVAIN